MEIGDLKREKNKKTLGAALVIVAPNPHISSIKVTKEKK
tara:strand:+ start:770 stop:886 length:117 start_codon:yes stop_codon:yes gene_type:complete